MPLRKHGGGGGGGGDGYRCKGERRKLTLKKTILLPLLPGTEPVNVSITSSGNSVLGWQRCHGAATVSLGGNSVIGGKSVTGWRQCHRVATVSRGGNSVTSRGGKRVTG